MRPHGLTEDLSVRDRKVLDLFVQGFSDQEIALVLKVGVSAVMGYRVRLRSRLATFGSAASTPTERRTIDRRHVELLDENLRLQRELRQATERLQRTIAVSACLTDGAIHILALMHAAEATLVTGPPETIVFANHRAARLFGADEGGLEGVGIRDLTHAGLPEALREPGRRLFDEGGPDRETLGIDRPFYALRKNGASFRAVVQAERFATPNGLYGVVTVRQLLEAAETFARALRRPLGRN